MQLRWMVGKGSWLDALEEKLKLFKDHLKS